MQRSYFCIDFEQDEIVMKKIVFDLFSACYSIEKDCILQKKTVL